MVLKIKVENMQSSNGNDIPNQFIIKTEEGTYFQSYQSIIAFIPNNGKTQIGKNWAYSVTTGKYRNQFLGETKEQTKAKLDSGEYILNPEL
jgi:hypothetical protein